MKAYKANSVIFFLATIWWLDALKRIEKIIRQNAFEQKKKKPRLRLNPGLVLISLQTTGPWSCDKDKVFLLNFIRININLINKRATMKERLSNLHFSANLYNASQADWRTCSSGESNIRTTVWGFLLTISRGSNCKYKYMAIPIVNEVLISVRWPYYCTCQQKQCVVIYSIMGC